MSNVHVCVEGQEIDNQGRRTGRQLDPPKSGQTQQRQQQQVYKWFHVKELGKAAHSFYPASGSKGLTVSAYVEAPKYESGGTGQSRVKAELAMSTGKKRQGCLRFNIHEFREFLLFLGSDAFKAVALALESEAEDLRAEIAARRQCDLEWRAETRPKKDMPVAQPVSMTGEEKEITEQAVVVADDVHKARPEESDEKKPTKATRKKAPKSKTMAETC